MRSQGNVEINVLKKSIHCNENYLVSILEIEVTPFLLRFKRRKCSLRMKLQLLFFIKLRREKPYLE